jgi:hypothetical protein
MLERRSRATRLIPHVGNVFSIRDLLTKRQHLIAWPTPPNWDEDEPPIREIDHTDDDPGPEKLPDPELLPVRGTR